MEKGKLIVIEGADATGKTTQVELLVRWINKTGGDAVSFANVSDSIFGKAIRSMLSDPDLYVNNKQAACMFITELHYLTKQIKAYIDKGITVVCSRHYLSTLAYAGTTNEIRASILTMGEYEVMPDVVVYLDLDIDTIMTRLDSRNEPKEIYETREKLTKILDRYDVAIGYSDANTPYEIIIIDAADTIGNVLVNIVKAIEDDFFSIAGEAYQNHIPSYHINDNDEPRPTED